MPTALSTDLSEARKRFDLAKTGWQDIRDAYNKDNKRVNLVGGQWEATVAERRKNSGLPVLEFNELQTSVYQISNRARKERPQPKVSAGEGGDPSTAEMLEGKLRHIQDASHADVAYDCAVECSASGGFGFYEITAEYLNDPQSVKDPLAAFYQEPRVKRILDPTTIYFDPSCQEPDFSDAKYCFVRQTMKRESFKAKYKVDPVDFEDSGDYADWVDKDEVHIAAYWYVETTIRKYVALLDGAVGYEDEIGDQITEENYVVQERDDEERTVYRDVIDGKRTLEHKEWAGKWIGIIPVLGRQVMIEGKQHLLSAVRFAADAQELKNSSLSGMAWALGTLNDTPFLGPKGSMPGVEWSDQKHHAKLEWLPVVEPTTMTILPPPVRNAVEPAIQGFAQAASHFSDEIQRQVGRVDPLIRPMPGNISGVAEKRRDEQTELTNFHFQDNLTRSQWHAGRVMLDLFLNLTDTSRLTKVMKEDGSTHDAAIARNVDGVPAYVPGVRPEEHHRIDVGNYNVTIYVGPAYASKIEEESDFLTAVLQVDPMLWPQYADVVFKLKGYHELEERARLSLPPAIQQSMQGKQNGIPPAVQAQMAQQAMVIQKLQQGIQELLLAAQTKQVENEGRLKIQTVKTAGEITKVQLQHQHEKGMAATDHAFDVHQQVNEHRHDAATQLFQHNVDAIHKLTELNATASMAMANNQHQAGMQTQQQQHQSQLAAQQPKGVVR